MKKFTFILCVLLFTNVINICSADDSYTILRKWYPHKNTSALGLEVLLNKEKNENQLIWFIKKIKEDKKIVIIRIFTNREAYENEKKGIYGELYDKHYILYYTKNEDRGINEIRWMQKKGQFEKKFGTKRRFFPQW